jgi:hypothetical protein
MPEMSIGSCGAASPVSRDIRELQPVKSRAVTSAKPKNRTAVPRVAVIRAAVWQALFPPRAGSGVTRAGINLFCIAFPSRSMSLSDLG